MNESDQIRVARTGAMAKAQNRTVRRILFIDFMLVVLNVLLEKVCLNWAVSEAGRSNGDTMSSIDFSVICERKLSH